MATIVMLLLNFGMFFVVTNYFPEIATATDTRTLILVTLAYLGIKIVIALIVYVIMLGILLIFREHPILMMALAFIFVLIAQFLVSYYSLIFLSNKFANFTVTNPMVLAIISTVISLLTSINTRNDND